ncbi:hypothetical protein [Risungbinella massiliensis]|uniref:hypothetical protein n=1 Tax=Risungbinella massiliensis TaxID=1329796 RepID=UPI0005CC6FFF|nr:hypothetical protein [Risungbinella massiliensis]
MSNRTKALPLRQKESIEQVAATISKESLESIRDILTETVYSKATELLQEEIAKSLSQIENHIEDIVETKMQELLLTMLNGIKSGKEQFQKENTPKKKRNSSSNPEKKASSNQKTSVDSNLTEEIKDKILLTLQKHQELELKKLIQLAEVEVNQKPTQVMNQLMKAHPQIQKTGRSTYKYVQEQIQIKQSTR